MIVSYTDVDETIKTASNVNSNWTYSFNVTPQTGQS